MCPYRKRLSPARAHENYRSRSCAQCVNAGAKFPTRLSIFDDSSSESKAGSKARTSVSTLWYFQLHVIPQQLSYPRWSPWSARRSLAPPPPVPPLIRWSPWSARWSLAPPPPVPPLIRWSPSRWCARRSLVPPPPVPPLIRWSPSRWSARRSLAPPPPVPPLIRGVGLMCRGQLVIACLNL